MDELKVKRLTDTAKLPVRANPTDAGLDIFADEDVFIHHGEVKLVSIGIAVEIQPGFFGLLCGRSGLSYKTMLRVEEGKIDAPYRGELKINCYCQDAINYYEKDGYYIDKGDKIAQLIILPCSLCSVEEVDELSETDRGAGGFGSTGV